MSEPNVRILVADDEESIRWVLATALSGEGYGVEQAETGKTALEQLLERHYDLAFVDIRMPDLDGLSLLSQARDAKVATPIIIITAQNTMANAIEAMKRGAYDYITKPFDIEEVHVLVRRILDMQRQAQDLMRLEKETRKRFELGVEIVGKAPAMQEIFKTIGRVAPTDATVLIQGESGTGKELIARAIHYNSLRKDKPFVAVDCNSLSENLLESEMFGHVKGSFTGAVANKRGMFEVADGGTLFLDEIGNLSMSTQAKLLRVIQEREFKAVGDTRTQSANFRLITATNKDLKAMVAEGTFREDLYYRINIFPIHIPPLRERRDDIPGLAFHFLRAFSEELGKKVTEFSEGAMSVLVNYDWPGNVRELENTIHRAAILATDKVVRQAHLVNIMEMMPRFDLDVPKTSEELKQIKKVAREKSVENIEKLFVLEALKRNAWNVTRSAEETGMQRANFQALMKKHNVRIREGDPNSGDAEPS